MFHKSPLSDNMQLFWDLKQPLAEEETFENRQHWRDQHQSQGTVGQLYDVNINYKVLLGNFDLFRGKSRIRDPVNPKPEFHKLHLFCSKVNESVI